MNWWANDPPAPAPAVAPPPGAEWWKGDKEVGGGAMPYADNIMRQVASGATLGFSDELAAAGEALTQSQNLGGVGGDSMLGGPSAAPRPAFGPVYDAELKANRDRDKSFAKENPLAAAGAQVGGAILTLPLMPILAPAKGVHWLTRMAAGGLTGAGYGGAAGFGHGEGGFDRRIKDAGVGAMIGAGIGAAAPPLISGAQLAGRAIAESPAGQYVGRNIASGLREDASLIQSLSPKAKPASLSAAAPDGGVPVPTDNAFTRVASALEGAAATADAPVVSGAQKRILDSFIASGRDPARLTREADRLGPDAMPLNLGGQPTLRVARAAKTSSPGSEELLNEAFNAQAGRMTPRMVADIDAAAGSSTPFRQAFDKGQAARDAEATTLYGDAAEAAKAWTGGIGAPTDELKAVMQVPIVRDLMTKIRDKAAQAGEDLSPLDVAQRVKQELAKMARAVADDPGSSKTDITKLAGRFQAALRDANPKFALADDAYAAASGVQDAMELGRHFMKRGIGGVADDVKSEALAKLTTDQVKGFAIGLADTMRDAVSSGGRGARAISNEINDATNSELRKRLTIAFGEKDAQRIFDMAYREATFAHGRNYTMAGSQSADKINDALSGFSLPNASQLSISPQSMFGFALDKGRQWHANSVAGNEQVKRETTRLISDPAETAKLVDAFEREMLRRRSGAPLITRAAPAIGAREAGQ